MKKFLLGLGIFFICSNLAFAQKILLEQDVTKDTIKQTFGPNLKYFGHLYGGFGFAAGSAEKNGSAIDYIKSHEVFFGYRFKYKVGNLYALGFDLAIGAQTFQIKQEMGKTLPTAQLYDKEKLKFTNLGLGLFNRFNFDKRGNYVGKFLDLGAYGNWMPFKSHSYQSDYPGPLSGAGKIKIKETGLKYLTDFNYGVFMRLGSNQYALYASYRLSDLFDNKYEVLDESGRNVFDFAELPRIMAGLQISLHQ